MSTAVWPKPPRNIQGYEALAMQEQYHQEHFRELHTKSMVIWYHGQTCPHVRWSHMSSKSPNIHADTNGVSTSLMDDTSQIIHHRQDYTCWIGSTPMMVDALFQTVNLITQIWTMTVQTIRLKLLEALKQMVTDNRTWSTCRWWHAWRTMDSTSRTCYLFNFAHLLKMMTGTRCCSKIYSSSIPKRHDSQHGEPLP
mgnify:CR=1 FL=1